MAQEKAQDRAARITRIVKVQEQLHRAEERLLARLTLQAVRKRVGEGDAVLDIGP